MNQGRRGGWGVQVCLCRPLVPWQAWEGEDAIFKCNHLMPVFLLKLSNYTFELWNSLLTADCLSALDGCGCLGGASGGGRWSCPGKQWLCRCNGPQVQNKPRHKKKSSVPPCVIARRYTTWKSAFSFLFLAIWASAESNLEVNISSPQQGGGRDRRRMQPHNF